MGRMFVLNIVLTMVPETMRKSAAGWSRSPGRNPCSFSAAAAPVLEATRTIPIVFWVSLILWHQLCREPGTAGR